MLEAYAKNYRLLWNGHWWWQSRRRFVVSWLVRLAARRPLGRILDIGSGDGIFFDDFSLFGEPWGVETDASLVDPAGKWASRIKVAPFGAEYEDSRDYDLVTMLDSIEHIEDDAAAVRRAAGLLKPGGLLFATVPALPSLWSVHDEANRHFRRYTRPALRTLLESAGLEVETVGFFFGWPVLPLYARKLIGFGRTRTQAAGEYEVLPPPRALNAVLYAATVVEQFLTGRYGTPIGSSLFAVARRPEAA